MFERPHCLWNHRRAEAKNCRLDGNAHYRRVGPPGVPSITSFVIAHREALGTKPSAFIISVSLSAVLEGARTEAKKYVDSFVSVTGWRPRRILLLGGALRFTEYDYFQEQIVKFIVMKRGDAPE